MVKQGINMTKRYFLNTSYLYCVTNKEVEIRVKLIMDGINWKNMDKKEYINLMLKSNDEETILKAKLLKSLMEMNM